MFKFQNYNHQTSLKCFLNDDVGSQVELIIYDCSIVLLFSLRRSFGATISDLSLIYTQQYLPQLVGSPTTDQL